MLRVITYFCCAVLFCFPLAGRAGDAPALLLAKAYRGDIVLADYWLSEKLDGVRAYWNGTQLLSRSGRIYHSPDWFTAGFPDTPLDGELWMGRGSFDTLSGIVRRQSPDTAQWRRVRYMVFDLPAAAGTFDQRLAQLRQLIAELNSPYLAMVEQSRVATEAALMARLDAVVRGGGEGLMLHRGSSRYRAARSDDLLKLKKHQDAEAVVVAHLPGEGKYRGMLGALLVERADGVRFRLGSGFSDAQRAAPPEIGSMVTYKYYGTTSHGRPRFASFLRVRPQE